MHTLVHISILIVSIGLSNLSCIRLAENQQSCSSLFSKFDIEVVNSDIKVVELDNTSAFSNCHFYVHTWRQIPYRDKSQYTPLMVDIRQDRNLILVNDQLGRHIPIIDLHKRQAKRAFRIGVHDIVLDEVLGPNTANPIFKYRLVEFIDYGDMVGRSDAVLLVDYYSGIIGAYHSDLYRVDSDTIELVCNSTGNLSNLIHSRYKFQFNRCDIM